MLSINPIRAFNDNYIWCIHDAATRSALVVDPGDASPVIEFLQQNKLSLQGILITHHHFDHIQGVRSLKDKYQCPVIGSRLLSLPERSHEVDDGDTLNLLGRDFNVLAVPGHTEDHIAYFCPAAAPNTTPWLFCGDTLFSGGCGRLLGGTAEQLHRSLSNLAQLPTETEVYCAHEYTLANLEFAQTLMPSNTDLATYIEQCKQRRKDNLPTIPSTLGTELKINPFLRPEDPEVKRAIEKHFLTETENDFEIFRACRKWKDNF